MKLGNFESSRLWILDSMMDVNGKKMGGTYHGSGTALTHVKEACCSRTNSIGVFRKNFRNFRSKKERAAHPLPGG